MSFQALARTWRPRRFDELVGQAHVVRALTHALELFEAARPMPRQLHPDLGTDRDGKAVDLKVVHSWEANRRNTGNRPATDEEKRDRPPVTHPLIRTHPETGRKSLYLSPGHTTMFDGWTEDESAGRKVLVYATRFPILLVIAFGAIFLYFRSRGGYKPVGFRPSSDLKV
mgnify:CR=1 FL=1